jgi:hypothetical protein
MPIPASVTFWTAVSTLLVVALGTLIEASGRQNSVFSGAQA